MSAALPHKENQVIWIPYKENQVTRICRPHRLYQGQILTIYWIKSLIHDLSSATGPWFNIKMASYQYRKSHCGDKTVVRSSYLHNGISYTGKMSSLYWIRAQIIKLQLKSGYGWVLYIWLFMWIQLLAYAPNVLPVWLISFNKGGPWKRLNN